MRQLLITIAAVLLVGCGESQQSAPAPEAKEVQPVAGAKAPNISIHDAAKKGNIAAVKQHLAAGTDVNLKFKGATSLHLAADYGHKEIVELLIANGADVNAKGEWEETPLHRAAAVGHKEITKLLITNGADVNAKDRPIGTPLDSAMKYKTTEIVDLLRKHGAKTGEELKAAGN